MCLLLCRSAGLRTEERLTSYVIRVLITPLCRGVGVGDGLVDRGFDRVGLGLDLHRSDEA